ncbi:MAG: stage 0 sporulation family protein [Clostridia bacterium]|nr:stage 0 sporulation family protein [Clostridia bacterium]
MKIIGVRFRQKGKVYLFLNEGFIKIKKGDFVIVETAQGEELGEVLLVNKNIVEPKEQKEPLGKLIRIANESDINHYEENLNKEEEAFKIAKKKIKEFKLDMKLISAEYLFDNSKLLFYFNAEGRIDFRDLVKELASIFKTRIELRQIGVRDEIRKIGGNGVCGRELCCCSFLSNFDSVSIKMAKEQNIALNPSKISGNCGRLMCCLKYEQEVYEEKLSRLPKQGAVVKTSDGQGIVDNVETLKEVVRVKLKDKEGFFYKKYNADEVEIIKNTDIGEKVSKEEKEHLKELKKLEKLDNIDKKNSK